MNTAIIPHLPTHVDLYYVDYNDSLSENSELLEEALRANSLDPIHEKTSEWWDGCDSTKSYIDDIRNKLEEVEIELSDDDKEEIRDWLYDNDKSTPTTDLLRNTGSINMFYSLGLEVGGWSEPGFMCQSFRSSSIAQEACDIRSVLGITKGTTEAERIDSILENASYGGELRVYFSIGLTDAISEEEDFQQIHFKGQCTVAVYHSNGSGDFESIELDKSFPFTRDNLFTSTSDKYSLENCFGLSSDWLRDSADPTFSTEPLKSKRKIVKSENAARITQEAEYKRVFKAGGCSAGDMDYNRHRGVYYDNNIPCGSHCPHCNTFWID